MGMPSRVRHDIKIRTMRVAIIGSKGQIGTDLLEISSAKHKEIRLTHADIEVSDIDILKRVFSGRKTSAVLSTAAAHNDNAVVDS